MCLCVYTVYSAFYIMYLLSCTFFRYNYYMPDTLNYFMINKFIYFSQIILILYILIK